MDTTSECNFNWYFIWINMIDIQSQRTAWKHSYLTQQKFLELKFQTYLMIYIEQSTLKTVIKPPQHSYFIDIIITRVWIDTSWRSPGSSKAAVHYALRGGGFYI